MSHPLGQGPPPGEAPTDGVTPTPRGLPAPGPAPADGVPPQGSPPRGGFRSNHISYRGGNAISFSRPVLLRIREPTAIVSLLRRQACPRPHRLPRRRHHHCAQPQGARIAAAWIPAVPAGVFRARPDDGADGHSGPRTATSSTSSSRARVMRTTSPHTPRSSASRRSSCTST